MRPFPIFILILAFSTLALASTPQKRHEFRCTHRLTLERARADLEARLNQQLAASRHRARPDDEKAEVLRRSIELNWVDGEATFYSQAVNGTLPGLLEILAAIRSAPPRTWTQRGQEVAVREELKTRFRADVRYAAPTVAVDVFDYYLDSDSLLSERGIERTREVLALQYAVVRHRLNILTALDSIVLPPRALESATDDEVRRAIERVDLIPQSLEAEIRTTPLGREASLDLDARDAPARERYLAAIEQTLLPRLPPAYALFIEGEIAHIRAYRYLPFPVSMVAWGIRAFELLRMTDGR